MGRHRLYRDRPLWVRVKNDNLSYLDKLCRLSKLSRTEFVDLHLEFLKDNIPVRKACTLVKKRGNQIQGEVKNTP